MKFPLKALTLAIASISYVSIAAAEDTPNKVQRVEVTGSSIKRVQKEGAAAVETVNKKALEKTAATTVQEVVKNVASLDFDDSYEQKSNYPSASGSAFISMRGLDSGDTLILLDGRRLPKHAMSGGQSFDINALPMSAIERVDILKDGGSAIYGADAVAGVVNFITKKNYQGGEIRSSIGQSSRGDGTEKTAGITGGFGDLEEDGFNFFGSFDVLTRDPILTKDRDISKTADYRRFGGSDLRSSYSPYGNVQINKKWTQVAPGCPADLIKSNGQCSYDFNQDVLTLSTGADRKNLMMLGRVKLNEKTQAYAQYLYAESNDHFEAHPAPGGMPYYKNGQMIDKNGNVTTDPAKQVYFNGRFMQPGLRVSEKENKLSNIVLGVDGQIFDFDWSIAGGYGVSTNNNRDSGVHKGKFFDALANQLIDPTSSNNNQAVIDSLKIISQREAKLEQAYFDAKVSGETGLTLGGGAVVFALGTSFTHEKLTDIPDYLQQNDQVYGSIKQVVTEGSRSGKAVFGEVIVPVLKSLELQAALRYDSYQGGNSKFSPRFAARFQPISNLMVRASYSESFRMPTLQDLYQGPSQGAHTFSGSECDYLPNLSATDLADCKKNGINGQRTTSSNPDLKPEKGQSINLGLVGEAGPFSGSVDWWMIKKDDVISDQTYLEALQAGQIAPSAEYGWMMSQKKKNRNKQENIGIDTDMKLRFPTSLATFTFSNNNSYYLSLKKSNDTGSMEDWVDTYGEPQWRNTFRFDVEKDGWSGGVGVRTTASFQDVNASPDDKENYDPEANRIASHTEVDLTLAYTGIKNLRIDAAVKNVFDRMPPFSNVASGTYSAPGFAPLYTARGSFYQLGVKYSF
ncbi:TonB-dependent receptor [Iodobacter fluviatilis]|uniref:Colicin I receptor n=1 Tax=Iodobacter fluviatilis TaxID=537 RepID=A0A377SVU3_9NEIS|nr:TonB-dependent receptor [Iodobacter fluviatilis]TCU88004.1 iron complex outermembrane receptor protein [Iodobacter fluviatilis]STR45505.1 Colicin I receptor precursor [Iodobacter fluviatilis]